MISRRRFLALPAVALAQGWPDRPQTEPEEIDPSVLASWVTVLRYIAVNQGQRLARLEACVGCGETMPDARGLT